MVRFFKWFYCLSKRLYKNAAFIIVILLIPLSALAFKLTVKKQEGFFNIAVVNEDSGGIGNEITASLKADSVITDIAEYKSEKAAVEDLTSGKIDVVWILPADIGERINKFAKDPGKNPGLVRAVITGEDIKTRLVGEELFGAVYPFISRQFYLNCVRNSGEFDLSQLSDEEVFRYYENFWNEGELFEFAPPSGSQGIRENEKNILVSPLRGLLSVVVMLGGFAATMLFIRDSKNGVFSWAKSSTRVLISFAAQFTAALNISVFVFAAVFALGVNTAVWREVLILFIFAANAALFCTLLGILVKDLNIFACVATFLAVAEMALCPIFFSFRRQHYPQLIFPNTYYINSVHNNVYLLYSVIYCALLSAALAAVYLKRRRQV